MFLVKVHGQVIKHAKNINKYIESIKSNKHMERFLNSK